MMWMLPAVGALGGALMNKKDPLKGALLGGGLGLAGGAALPALGAGAAGAGTQAGMLAAQEAGMGLGTLGWKGATTGVQGALNSMGGAKGLLDATGKAMGVANQVKGMMPQDQPIPQAPAFTSGGPAPMTNFYSQMQANKMAQGQNDMMRKQRRQSLIG